MNIFCLIGLHEWRNYQTVSRSGKTTWSHNYCARHKCTVSQNYKNGQKQ